MLRHSFTTFLILALFVGGVFEMVKRTSLLSPPTSSGREGQFSTLVNKLNLAPYVRALKQEENTELKKYRQARAKIMRDEIVQLKRLQQEKARALMIPPKEGKFDAHGPKAIAKNATPSKIQGDKKNADKDTAAGPGKKKCRPKVSFAPAGIVANAPIMPAPVAMNAQPAKGETVTNDPDQPTPEEECEEDSETNVAKEEKPEEDKKDDDDTANELTADTAPAFVGGLAPTVSPHDDSSDLAMWKERLLNQPDFKETVRLIEAAQSGQISTDLFKTIVGLMLASPKAEIRELGVLAAGRVPSYESFHLLVGVLKKESQGSRLRQRAEAEIDIYQQPSYLHILERVLKSSPEILAVIWAAKLAEDSAKIYLSAKYNRPRPGKTGHPYAKYYERLIATLQTLVQQGGTNDHAIQARQTLQSIQNLLRAIS